jgi:hypothetical protein
MKKIFGILLCAFISAGAQSNSTNIAGGLSFAVGEGSEDMNPGLFVSLAPDHRVNEMFTIGGHGDYSWFTAKTNIRDLHGNLHLIDVAFVPKLFAKLTDETKVFLEIDPGLLFSIAQVNYLSASDSDFNTYFAMTYGIGLKFSRVLFGFKFKTSFTENETAKWINFYAGYSGE